MYLIKMKNVFNFDLVNMTTKSAKTEIPEEKPSATEWATFAKNIKCDGKKALNAPQKVTVSALLRRVSDV